MTAYEADVRPTTPRNRGDYDAPHMSPVTPTEDLRSVVINRVAWGPVIAGVAMTLVVQLILNLAGIGIGIATLTPDTTSNWAVANLSLGTAIWWTVSSIISSYIGGYAAGRLSGEPVESSAGWHGLTSWAVSALILSGLIMAGAGTVMGGMLNAVHFTGTGVQVPVATTTAMDNVTLSKIIMQGALLSALVLVFGGLAAWFGGREGTVRPTVTDTSITDTRMNLH